jgi:hypothetical protein
METWIAIGFVAGFALLMINVVVITPRLERRQQLRDHQRDIDTYPERCRLYREHGAPEPPHPSQDPGLPQRLRREMGYFTGEVKR